MPNGEQEQYQEGEESGGESMDWQSDGGEEEEESEDSSSGEEVESPPHNERRSKHKHDPTSISGNVAKPTRQTSKHTRTSSPVLTEKASKQPKVAASKSRKTLPKIKIDVPVTSAAATSGTSAYRDGDEVMEDAVTSNTAPPNVIDLPDDDEDVPLRPMGRRSRKISTGKVPQSTPVTEPVIQETGDANRASKSCELGAHFADLEQKQIQLNLDLELAKTNLHKAKDEAAETMNQAQAKKDLDLAAAQKAAEEKTALADQKLASVDKLEEENAKLKTALDEANKEATRLKKDKRALTDKVEDIARKRDELENYLGGLAKKLFIMLEVGKLEEENTKLKTALDEANNEATRLKKDKRAVTDKVEDIARKRDELENYLGGLAKKLFVMLEEFCQNFEEETGRIETSLDPILSTVKDEAAMNVLRLESRVTGVVDYLARLKVAVSRIDTSLWPGATLQNYLESLITRLNEVPALRRRSQSTCTSSSLRIRTERTLYLLRSSEEKVTVDQHLVVLAD
nr:rab11 family-interacting protein 4B-like [Aegilops tauschii subsp. strangulata]